MTEEPATAEPVVPAPPAPPSPAASIELATTRRLLSVAFDLLGRSSQDMRRASFYIGSIVLGTMGPLALATWAIEVVAVDRTPEQMEAALLGGGGVALSLAAVLAFAGLIVAAVESRTIAAGLLGGQMAGRPITPRQALARSRRVFWSAVLVAIIVAIPLAIAQAVVGEIVMPILGEAADLSVITTTLVTATLGSPFAYVLAGVVLGDVDPVEAVRRSFRVFGARKLAAALIVTFETVAILLIYLGISVGLDVAIRVLDALGLGVESGPLGLAVMTGGIVAAVFAFGTLIYTVIGITVAPQVVMFVGLTHATLGLEHVRPGGRDDPDAPPRPGVRRFRTWTRPMLAGFAIGAGILAIAVAAFTA